MGDSLSLLESSIYVLSCGRARDFKKHPMSGGMVPGRSEQHPQRNISLPPVYVRWRWRLARASGLVRVSGVRIPTDQASRLLTPLRC